MDQFYPMCCTDVYFSEFTAVYVHLACLGLNLTLICSGRQPLIMQGEENDAREVYV
jgi:hypothetical protein